VRHGKVKVYPNLVLKTSMYPFDAIILGLGGMGSAAAAHLAARGRRVLGLEQFTPVHDRGSSHGQTRIIRQAYWEDPAYVPLVLRAYELWFELARRSGRSLYLKTGGLMVGSQDSALIRGSRRSALEHGLRHEMLGSHDIRLRFPATRPLKDEVALFEEPAGILFPEACVRAHLDWAAESGADLRFESPVASWQSIGQGVRVTTGGGELFETRALVITAGAWLGEQAKELDLPLRIERNVAHWFAPAERAELFSPERLPIWILERDARSPLYGFPDLGAGVKAAFHHSHDYSLPGNIDRNVAAEEVERVRDALAGWLPDANGPHLASSVCMYTLTPDEHFLIGCHPSHANVFIAGGFSGHGFKFCSVVGEVIADLLTTGTTRHPVDLFSFSRLATTK
jgi:sarcosine oxidase